MTSVAKVENETENISKPVSRFSVTSVPKEEVKIENESGKTQNSSRFSVATVQNSETSSESGLGSDSEGTPRVLRREKFTISSNSTIPETAILSPAEDDYPTLDRGAISSVGSDFEPFQEQKSRFQTMSVQSAPIATLEPNTTPGDQEKVKLQSQFSLPDQLDKSNQKGRFQIRKPSNPIRKGR